jgi:acid phosphatase
MIRLRRLTVVAGLTALLGSGVVAASAGQTPAMKAPAAAAAAVTPLPKPDHVVIVVLENKRYDSVVGHPKTPYITSLAKRWANMTRFYAETHPSQPNYLALFSGSTQGVMDNNCPHDLGSRPNLGRQLIDAGYTFAGYSQDLPSVGFTGCHYKQYVRRHNPWVNFSNIPSTANRPYTMFPKDYRKLPTVSFVVPNLCDDMHDCPKVDADAWLRTQFAPYISWATTHNSLFILTFDEDNKTDNNHIATIVAGAGVKAGQYAPKLDHYHLLRTLQEIYGLKPTGYAARRPPLRGLWVAP